MLSKYQPLVDYLLARPDADEIVLGFREIEMIVGVSLPEAMQIEQGLWKRPHLSYVQRWEAGGWNAALDRRNQCVHFTRTKE